MQSTQYTKREIERGNKRLLRLARILRKIAADPDTRDTAYYQPSFFVPGFMEREVTCGTRACGLGHYATHTPSRWRVDRRQNEYSDALVDATLVPVLKGSRRRHNEFFVDWSFRCATAEFSITRAEASDLFDGEGCDYAGTNALKAARFIERFVARRRRRG